MSDKSAIELEDDDFEDFDPDGACTWCCGDGLQEGDRLGWDVPGELVPCRACDGTGNRSAQVVF